MHVHLYMFESETTSKTCFLYAPPKFTGLETSQLGCGEAFYLTFTFLCIRIKLKGRKESVEEGTERGSKEKREVGWIGRLGLTCAHCKDGFLGGSDSEEPSHDPGDLSSILGLGRSPREGNCYPLQYSSLENSMDRGVWQATVHGVQRFGRNSVTNTQTHTHNEELTHWKRPWCWERLRAREEGGDGDEMVG